MDIQMPGDGRFSFALRGIRQNGLDHGAAATHAKKKIIG